MQQPETADTYTAFLKLFVPLQLSLRRFVTAHIPGFHQAEDTFQQVALVLWKEFGNYDASRPFAPWAYGVAWNVVLKARRTAARDRHVFQDDVAEKITERLVADADDLDARQGSLQHCLENVSAENRSLLEMKYTQRKPINEIAAAIGRTPNAVRLVLFRVRTALAHCLETLSAGEQETGEVAL